MIRPQNQPSVKAGQVHLFDGRKLSNGCAGEIKDIAAGFFELLPDGGEVGHVPGACASRQPGWQDGVVASSGALL